MSDLGFPVPSTGRDALRRGLAQYRTPAFAVGTYGALLLVPWGIGRREGSGAGLLLPLAASLVLLLLDWSILLWLNVALEHLPGGKNRDRWADRLKGLALAAALGFGLAAGWVSLRSGARLRLGDAWRYARNAVQLVQEATVWERTLLILFSLFILTAAAALARSFQRERVRAAGIAPPLALGLTAAAALGLATIATGFAQARPLLRVPLPEGRLLARSGFPLERHFRALPPLLPADLEGAPIVPFEPPEQLPRSNVVILMLEAIAWNHPSVGGGPPGVTPNLDALATECVVFPRAYAASTHSDYAQPALLSGLFPKKYLTHDFYDSIAYPRTLLWDALKPCGYTTAVFSTQNETWGNMIAFHRTAALDELWHSPSWPQAPRRGRSTETKVFEETAVGEWRRWFREHAGVPTLTYLNFQATHFPYEHPPSFPPLFMPVAIDFPASFIAYPKSKVPVMKNRFFNALRYADHWVGEVVRDLKESGAWDHTILLVAPDHGQAFYEHGFPTHGTSLHEEQVRSFALLHLPKEAPRRVEEPVSHLDFVPSLLKYLGLPRTGPFQGSDAILDAGYSAAGRPLFFSLQGLSHTDGILLDGWKYMMDWVDGSERLYDLSADPGERRNLAGRGHPEEEVLRRRLLLFQRRQINYYSRKVWEKGFFVPAAR